MASGAGGGNSLAVAKMDGKDKNGVTTATLVAVAVAVLAAWGLAKLFGGFKEKMMKAPGRDFYIPRKDFVNNPAAYFRSLRDKK